MTFSPDPMHNVRVLVYAAEAAAVEEERAWGIVGSEHIQKTGREHVRAVVEGQCHGSWDGAVVEDVAEGDGRGAGLEAGVDGLVSWEGGCGEGEREE